MPQAKGANSQIVYDVETVFGTTPGTPNGFILPFVSESLGQKRNLIRSNVIRSSRNQSKPALGNKDVGGSIVTELNAYMGTLFKHCLGTSVTTGTSPRTHTIKVGALPVSMCFEKGFTDMGQYFMYNGVRISKIGLDLKAEGPQQVTFDLLGQKETLGSVSFDSTPDATYGHDPFSGAEMTINEGGSAIATVKAAKLTFDNQLDGDMFTIGGGGIRRSIPEGVILCSGSITALFEDTTLINKAIGSTETSLKIIFQKGTGAGTAGNEYMDFDLRELLYAPDAPKIPGPKGITVELGFEAYLDNDAGASEAIITIKNSLQASL